MMRKNSIQDSTLISNYIQGDENALCILIKRHQQRLYSFIYSKIQDRDITEDIFQDTFLKVVKSLRLNRYKDDGRFIGWVLRIAHNLVIDHFRRQKNMRTISNTDGKVDLFNNAKFSDSTIEDQMITDQVRKKVKSLIDYLPEEQKEVVIMRHYMDLSFKEIADLTDVSINTALGRMRYALINMRKLIEKHAIQIT